MKHQPPSSNNPANPLFKVAALTLDKEYDNLGPNAVIRVIASLNFKRSDDLRGKASTINGEDITVCFSLTVQRASFELTFSPDDIRYRDAPIVELKKVAFASPLTVKDRVIETSLARNEADKAAAIQASGGMKLSASELPIQAGLSAYGKAGVRNRSSKSRRVARAYDRNNVTVTFGGNMIHWEISPRAEEDGLEGAYLEGEVFRNRTASTEACVAKRKSEVFTGPLVITGSVFTSMQHLHVEEVRFIDNNGDEVKWRDVDSGLIGKSSGTVLGSAFLSVDERKRRLLKQIIRKHLASQGMNVEGARVEICKAHT
jgi:hypothetical protein